MKRFMRITITMEGDNAEEVLDRLWKIMQAACKIWGCNTEMITGEEKRGKNGRGWRY